MLGEGERGEEEKGGKKEEGGKKLCLYMKWIEWGM